MVKVNLKEKLDVIADKKVQHIEPIEKPNYSVDDFNTIDVNSLLDELNNKDRDLLKFQGWKIDNITEESIPEATTQVNDRFYNIDHIQKLCTKYNLKFLSVSKYKGHVPAEIPYKMREALDDIGFTDDYIKENFKSIKTQEEILRHSQIKLVAPDELFDIKHKHEDSKMEKVVYYNTDPLCFIENPLISDNWILVHQWGDDLSVKNRITGFIKSYFTVLSFILAYIGIFSIYNLGGISDTSIFSRFGKPASILILYPFLATMIALIIKGISSMFCWNLDSKYIKGFKDEYK